MLTPNAPSPMMSSVTLVVHSNTSIDLYCFPSDTKPCLQILVSNKAFLQKTGDSDLIEAFEKAGASVLR